LGDRFKIAWFVTAGRFLGNTDIFFLGPQTCAGPVGQANFFTHRPRFTVNKRALLPPPPTLPFALPAGAFFWYSRKWANSVVFKTNHQLSKGLFNSAPSRSSSGAKGVLIPGVFLLRKGFLAVFHPTTAVQIKKPPLCRLQKGAMKLPEAGTI